MDEEKNEYSNVEKGIKKIGKSTGKGIKKIWKLVPISVRIFIYLALGVIIVGCVWWSTQKIGYAEITSTTAEQLNTKVTIEQNEDGRYELKLDLTIAEEIRKRLDEIQFDDSAIYLDENSKYLEKMLAAEVATSYPNLIPDDEQTEEQIDGIINIIRKDLNGNSKALTYIAIEQFPENENALDYYTIDESGNLVVATYTKATENGQQTEYTINQKKIPYKNILDDYGMPFEFTLALLQVSDNPEWISALTELVTKQSRIDLVIQDCLSVSTENYKYEADKWITVQEMKITKNGIEFETKDKGPESVTNTDVYKTYINTVEAYIETADVWFGKLTQEYNMEENTVTDEIVENTDINVIEGTPHQIGAVWHEDIVETTTITNDSITYQKGATVKEENIDKFLGLWKNKTGNYEPYYNSNGNVNENAKYVPTGKIVKYSIPKTIRKESPVDNILSATEALFELLESTQNTQNSQMILKYFLYKYTGVVYDGVTEIDFSAFDLASFNSVLSDDAFITFLKTWEGTKTDAQGNYIVHNDGRGIPTVAYGVALKYNVDRFAAKGVTGVENWKIGDHCLNQYGVSNEIIDDVMKEEIEADRESVRRKTATCNPPLNEQQIDALVIVTYQFGNIGNFVSVYNEYGNTEELKENVRAYNSSNELVHAFFKENASVGRAEANWKLFNEGKYTDKQGNEIVSAGNADIVELAQSKLGCRYVLGAHGPNTFDCSGFVEWCYRQVGISVPWSTNAYKSYQGSQYEITWEEVQPGDILIVFNTERGTTYGHAGIYIGNDQYIHAPQTGDVVKISTGAKSKFKHVFRF